MNIIERRVLHTPYASFIERLKRRGTPFYIRQGTECVEVVVDEVNYFFKTDRRFPLNFLYLFPLVRKEAKAWLGERTKVNLPPEYPSVKYNYQYVKRKDKIVGFDLNHAYWRIAKNYGIIKHTTYERALHPDAKAVRLAALSTMGRSKEYQYVKGQETLRDKQYTTQSDALLMDTYKLIRLTCFEMMYEASELLGTDFDCWKTDCIYFRDTPENREKMHDYFTDKGLTYKLLEF